MRASFPYAANRDRRDQYANAPRTGTNVSFVARKLRNAICAGPPVVSYPITPRGKSATPIVMRMFTSAKASHDEGFIGRAETIFEGRRCQNIRRAAAPATREIVAAIQRLIIGAMIGGDPAAPLPAKVARIAAAVHPAWEGYTIRQTAVRRTYRKTASPPAMGNAAVAGGIITSSSVNGSRRRRKIAPAPRTMRATAIIPSPMRSIAPATRMTGAAALRSAFRVVPLKKAIAWGSNATEMPRTR